ncbi:NAD(+) diphosphatase [Kangiella geojedonensis]|uniref:NAD(+) diphosphatase n=1 Tax=Kangiella geojedonensis TaxID=914150 RepID=A0A0F6RBW5_9GAMM|nr:NAD(+) diphosphatase [Kangiella geojedonensis]AKE51521.1 NUDIX hydrolase [Kangiella geojedonensis]
MFAFQTTPLNRHGEIRHTDDFINPLLELPNTYFLLVHQQSIVCVRSNTNSANSTVDHNWQPFWFQPQELQRLFNSFSKKHLIYLGEIDSKHYFTFRLKSSESLQRIAQLTPDTELELCNLRGLFKQLSSEQAHLCSVAVAMEHWHNTHQYCGFCGHETYSHQSGFVRNCSNQNCQKQHFPRTDSAVICAITYQDKILLGRQTSWPDKRYSVIAGFVEPGETLEQAVAREGYEETGLTLKHIEYYRSQPWPFPQSLMVGFTAEAVHPEIKLLDQELEEAHWFSRQELKAAVKADALVLPFKFSISRELINQWLMKI